MIEAPRALKVVDGERVIISQVTALIDVARQIIEQLNDVHWCDENKMTIIHLEIALELQRARTRDRGARGVEGTGEA